jgi:uncharacterized integral membrane protein
MRLLRRLLWVAFFAALLYVGWRFPTENAETISISYLAGTFEGVPVWVALIVAFVAGAVLATLVSWWSVAKLKLTARRYRKTVNDLEAEVHQLRNLPLSDTSGAAAPPAEELESGLGLERGG